MTGQIEFYDEPSAWGIILGADGRLYVVRGNHIQTPPPRVGEPVAFEPHETPGGLRAVAVRRLR